LTTQQTDQEWLWITALPAPAFPASIIRRLDTIVGKWNPQITQISQIKRRNRFSVNKPASGLFAVMCDNVEAWSVALFSICEICVICGFYSFVK